MAANPQTKECLIEFPKDGPPDLNMKISKLGVVVLFVLGTGGYWKLGGAVFGFGLPIQVIVVAYIKYNYTPTYNKCFGTQTTKCFGTNF